MFKFWILKFLLFAIFFANKVQSDDVSSTIVSTKSGPLKGVIKEARDGHLYVSFKGLRYASPAKRFEPALPLSSEDAWAEPQLADKFGNTCAQSSNFGNPSETEDCLFANVYVPKSTLERNSTNKLPVMVFIHGGGFSAGESDAYPADYFMEKGDVILVTVNYRLNVFGFLNMEDDVFTSNIGLRDIIAALQWVQENIAAFGGDSSLVTLFGQSAGSAAVHHVLLSPLSKGLYSRAIMQSGSVSFWGYSQQPRNTALKLAHHLKCPLETTNDTHQVSQEVRKCLEEKSTSELLKAGVEFWLRWPQFNSLARFVPSAVEDMNNPYYNAPPQTLYGGNTSYPNKVPVMIGVTKDEGSTIFASFVLSVEKDVKNLNDNWETVLPQALQLEEFFLPENLPIVAKKIRDFYFGFEPVSQETKRQLSEMYGDPFFLGSVTLTAREMARDGMAVYPYIFNYLGSRKVSKDNPIKVIEGDVGHGYEIQYFFPSPMFGKPVEPNSEDEAFSKKLVELWKSFAKKGKPSFDWETGQPLDWPEIKDTEDILDFNWMSLEKQPKIVMHFDFETRIQFWVDLIQEYGIKTGAVPP